MQAGAVEDMKIRHLSYGPSKQVKSYNGIVVNGYRFHTREYEQHKTTNNSGVCCRGSSYGEDEIDYYGVVEDIIELSYVGNNNNVFVFRCNWFDPINGVRLDPSYKLVDVKPRSRLQTYEPFILAQQAQQVYYTQYPNKRGRGVREWWAACKVRPRLFEVEQMRDDENMENFEDDYYHEDESSEMPQQVTRDSDDILLHDTNAVMDEIPINEIYIPMDFERYEQRIVEGEFDEDENDNVMVQNSIEHDADSESE